MLYKYFIQPLLFLLPAETAHRFVFSLLKIGFKIPGFSTLVKSMYSYSNPKLAQEFCGIKFPNPIGLGAGFDKNAELIDELACLGFGFIEIGTVTPKAQPGNEKPRLFRLKKDQALINRMGFNNEGLEKLVKRLQNRQTKTVIGGNIGKNKITSNENALDDYLLTFRGLYPYVDYFVVNVSSPNTPNLRALQEKEPLQLLLNTLQTENQKQAQPKPILLKIAPDLNESQLLDIVEVIKNTQIAGVIATNTTIARSNLLTSPQKISQIGIGGLSGKPLKNHSTEIIRFLRQNLGNNVLIIGIGGIFTAQDAKEKLEAGANLLQIYTGFIYEGPGIVKQILKKLVNE
jgi:dihydroorotate dehydrogenase